MFKEAQVDIFSEAVLKEADVVCVTTNGVIRRDGRAVMGAGVAKIARDKWPGIDKRLAHSLKALGNIVTQIYYIREHGTRVLSFPTKDDWKDKSKPALIEASAIRIAQMAEYFDWNVYLPRPGCSNGGLDWESQVKPILSKHLDDRFTVVTYNPRWGR